jgi:hypothetical protein
MTILHLYLYRPKQLRDYLATKLEPLKIVFRLKCCLLGFHNFGVDEVPGHRCWTCGKKRMVPDENTGR